MTTMTIRTSPESLYANMQNTNTYQVGMIIIIQKKNGDTERLDNLPKVTQVSKEAGFGLTQLDRHQPLGMDRVGGS